MCLWLERLQENVLLQSRYDVSAAVTPGSRGRLKKLSTEEPIGTERVCTERGTSRITKCFSLLLSGFLFRFDFITQ